MEESPFRSPALESTSEAPGEHDQLFRIAKYQRWVIMALLLTLMLIPVALGGGLALESLLDALDPESAWGDALAIGFLGFIYTYRIVVFILTLVAAYALSRQFYSKVGSVLIALSQLIPLVSLIVLLVLNVKATRFLKQRDVRVGFLGTSHASVRRQLRLDESATAASFASAN